MKGKEKIQEEERKPEGKGGGYGGATVGTKTLGHGRAMRIETCWRRSKVLEKSDEFKLKSRNVFDGNRETEVGQIRKGTMLKKRDRKHETFSYGDMVGQGSNEE